MIDWIKFSVGVQIAIFLSGGLVSFIWLLIITVDPDCRRANSGRYLKYSLLGIITTISLLYLPIVGYNYRKLVIFYARMTYGDSDIMCNELKEYGYICQGQLKVEVKK
jgi:hypothetical protein